MDGYAFKNLATECLALLNAWPGPGEDPEALAAITQCLECLLALAEPADPPNTRRRCVEVNGPVITLGTDGLGDE